ncbi:unnamed protein product [Aphanomyces euteiches]|nr:hypothetical protein AeRB84_005548 [Aphanomyces euteiches]
MLSGIVHGKLHDVMKCLYTDDSHTFRVHSALLMPKEFIDGEVLLAIDVGDDDHPFRFTGIKWCATKWPGSAVNKPRDLCYFESTGMVQTVDPATDQPTTFGYNIMESLHMPLCAPLGKLSVVRAKVSIRRIFRELPIGCTLVMTHCTINPCGALSSSSLWRSDVSSMPYLLAISKAAVVAESIWLTRQLPPCIEKQKTSFLAQARCALCRRNYTKMEKKCVIMCSPGDVSSIRATKRHFCTTCLIRPPSRPPRAVPNLHADDDDALPTDPALASSLTSLSSLHSSEYSLGASSRLGKLAALPILDLDNEDDEVDSVYTALEFDLRSANKSHDDLDESPSKLEDAQALHPRDCKTNNQDSLGAQLSFLAARMDDTLMLLQCQQTQMNYLASCDRVEYLFKLISIWQSFILDVANGGRTNDFAPFQLDDRQLTLMI